MSLIKRMRKQKAVYWAPGAVGDDGVITYGDPVELTCRWEGQEEQYVDRNGQTRISNAKVYVENELEGGGMLKKGEVADLESNIPSENDDVFEIMKVNDLPNLKAKEFLRWVTL